MTSFIDGHLSSRCFIYVYEWDSRSCFISFIFCSSDFSFEFDAIRSILFAFWSEENFDRFEVNLNVDKTINFDVKAEVSNKAKLCWNSLVYNFERSRFIVITLRRLLIEKVRVSSSFVVWLIFNSNKSICLSQS